MLTLSTTAVLYYLKLGLLLSFSLVSTGGLGNNTILFSCYLLLTMRRLLPIANRVAREKELQHVGFLGGSHGLLL